MPFFRTPAGASTPLHARSTFNQRLGGSRLASLYIDGILYVPESLNFFEFHC